MRCLFGFFLATLILVPALNAQESKNGFEFNFALVHPAKWGLNEYKYSVDPTFEVLYIKSVSKKFWVAGGIFAQTGKHNWIELDSHAYYDGWMWQRGRYYYSRQLEFFSVGIPVKIGMDCNNAVFNSLFLGFTAGNHLKLEMADYLNSEFVAKIPVYPYYPYYNSIFWELNFGFRKILFSKGDFAVSLSPFAGFRKETPGKDIGTYNYIFYGLGISSRFRK
jgi:hypothetical protein